MSETNERELCKFKINSLAYLKRLLGIGMLEYLVIFWNDFSALYRKMYLELYCLKIKGFVSLALFIKRKENDIVEALIDYHFCYPIVLYVCNFPYCVVNPYWTNFEFEIDRLFQMNLIYVHVCCEFVCLINIYVPLEPLFLIAAGGSKNLYQNSLSCSAVII